MSIDKTQQRASRPFLPSCAPSCLFCLPSSVRTWAGDRPSISPNGNRTHKESTYLPIPTLSWSFPCPLVTSSAHLLLVCLRRSDLSLCDVSPCMLVPVFWIDKSDAISPFLSTVSACPSHSLVASASLSLVAHLSLFPPLLV